MPSGSGGLSPAGSGIGELGGCVNVPSALILNERSEPMPGCATGARKSRPNSKAPSFEASTCDGKPPLTTGTVEFGIGVSLPLASIVKPV